jgi:hypothetical protein
MQEKQQGQKRDIKMKIELWLVVCWLIGAFFFGVTIAYNSEAHGDKCAVGKNHGDNKPSSKKGTKLLEEGASACTISKECDKQKIDIHIKDKQQLHQTDMYNKASDDVKEELDEAATHGHGHDSPNLVCYEVQYSVK